MYANILFPYKFSHDIRQSDKTLRYSKRRKIKRQPSFILAIKDKLEN